MIPMWHTYTEADQEHTSFIGPLKLFYAISPIHQQEIEHYPESNTLNIYSFHTRYRSQEAIRG